MSVIVTISTISEYETRIGRYADGEPIYKYEKIIEPFETRKFATEDLADQYVDTFYGIDIDPSFKITYAFEE